VNASETVVSADLGNSSNYSNEILYVLRRDKSVLLLTFVKL